MSDQQLDHHRPNLVQLILLLAEAIEGNTGRFVEERAELSLAQLRLLQILGRQHEIPLTELSQRLRCTKGNVTGLVTRLEERGYLARERDAQDRRIVVARLTAEGERAVLLADELDDYLDELSERMADPAREMVSDLLVQWLNRLQGPFPREHDHAPRPRNGHPANARVILQRSGPRWVSLTQNVAQNVATLRGESGTGRSAPPGDPGGIPG